MKIFDYFLISFISFFTVSLITPLIRKFALKIKALDRQDERKIHKKIVTNLGGIGIFVGFMFSSIFIFILAPSMMEHLRVFLIFLFASAIVFLLGIYDDLKGADVKIKLIGEILAALILIRAGIIIHKIYLFGHYIELPYFLALIITLGWFIVITNAINLIDGIDGLAAGIVFIVSLGLFFILGNHITFWGALLLPLGFAHLAFLRYNFPPAKIFMGDCGALTSGFILAGISLLLNYKRYLLINLAIPVVLLSIPLSDTLLAIIRRSLRKRSIFRGDREHIHHFFLKKGLTPREVNFLFYSVTIILSILAFMLKNFLRIKCR